MSLRSLRTIVINLCLCALITGLVIYVWRDIPPQPILGFNIQRFADALKTGAIHELSYQPSTQQIFGRIKADRRSEFGGDEFHIPAQLTTELYEEVAKQRLSSQRFLGPLTGLDQQAEFDQALSLTPTTATHAIFRPGEKASYDLTILGMSLGQLSMEVLPNQSLAGRPTLHLAMKAETSSGFASVYRATDSAETFVDLQTLLPLAFAMRMNESDRFGGIFEKQLDKEKLTRWTSLVSKTAGLKSQRQTLVQSEDVHNMVSLIYAIRAQDWKDAHRFQFSDQNKQIEIGLTPKREQTINTVRGPLDAVLLEPDIKISGEVKKAPPIEIWIQKQAPHLLLQMQADLKVGKIRATLSN